MSVTEEAGSPPDLSGAGGDDAGGARRSPASGGRPRRGLVLGAGGVLGFAWMVGALRALEDQEGFDSRDVDVCAGTSSGAILAALLGLGVGVDAILRHQQGIPLPGDPRIEWDYDSDVGGALPPRPGLRPGSRGLLLRVARHPRQLPPLVAVSAMLPRGRRPLQAVGRMIDAVAELSGQRAGGPAWPTGRQTWIMTMDYDGGRRVAFGRPGAPPARLADAVMASCAIPGWYAPIEIGGRRYVDGGTCSPASVDLLAGAGLDEAWVLAPMVSFAVDRPRSAVARVERQFRRASTRRVLREATRLRAAGTAVTVLGPGPADLNVMGANLMDPRRRVAVLHTSLRSSAEALRREGRPVVGYPPESAAR